VREFLKLEPATWELVQRLDLLSSAPLMLLPARITRRKNIEFGIRVTAALARHNQRAFRKPLARLVITGPPGPHNPTNIAYLESLRSLREELGVTQRVHFLYEHGDGRPLDVTDAMMADFYHLADLLLFPSRREGFGIPPLEAGLARLPIFAADIPTLQESAGDLAHLFDPEGDPEAVAEAIATHLESNHAYQMRRQVLNQFTWKVVLERHLIPLIEASSRSRRDVSTGD
jgi:glycosyltransferase involved in cell wall biosynthesis